MGLRPDDLDRLCPIEIESRLAAALRRDERECERLAHLATTIVNACAMNLKDALDLDELLLGLIGLDRMEARLRRKMEARGFPDREIATRLQALRDRYEEP